MRLLSFLLNHLNQLKETRLLAQPEGLERRVLTAGEAGPGNERGESARLRLSGSLP